jgi:phosphatidylserine/phosphatidylglycerophosphate/cardiolipin synthase-like enzyme
MNKPNYLCFVFLTTLAACSLTPGPVQLREPNAAIGANGSDLPLILQKAREYMIQSPEGKIGLKKVPESQFVEFLQANPEYIKEEQKKVIAAIESESHLLSDPTKHTRLIPPAGKPGYENLKVYVSHPYFQDGQLKPKDDLILAWINFIKMAKKEIVINVFDFDLVSVAELLVEKAQAGVKVYVGVDKGVVAARPEVKRVVKILSDGGVKVTQVNSVGLNHQKVTAIDWSSIKDASVLFSSGNLTHSCLDKDGDLRGLDPLPKESVPNANHLITMKSFVLANLVRHELIKTLDDKFLLRGKQFPINGSYQVTGPGIDPYVLEAYPEPSIIITFAPNGGLKNINRNLIAHVLKKEKGSVRMIQFAFSSLDVEEALLWRAQQDTQETGNFDFKSVGDTPFAMREWSRFLIMSGLKMDITPTSKTYSDDKDGKWWKTLGETQIQKIRKGIYVAPKIYGDHHLKINNKSLKSTGKIHHKILATPNFAIVGTSFNFSQGAESNNEQLLIFRDKKMSKLVDGMLKYLIDHSPGTVHKEALRRNVIRGKVLESESVEDRAAN